MPGPNPGMILDMNDAINFGAYADIFRPSQGPLACKLFISVRHETNVKQGLTDPPSMVSCRTDFGLVAGTDFRMAEDPVSR